MRILVLLVTLLLASCSAQNNFSAEQRAQDMRLRKTITAFTLAGEVKYRSRISDGWHHGFFLKQTAPGRYTLQFVQPDPDESKTFIEVSKLTVSEASAQFETAEGQTVQAQTPQALMRDLFKSDLPLYHLPDLVLGMIGEAKAVFFQSYDDYLTDVALRDAVAGGYWSIKLGRYKVVQTSAGSLAMPMRIEIEHAQSPVGERFEFIIGR